MNMMISVDLLAVFTRIAEALERIAANTSKPSEDTKKSIEGFNTVGKV